MAVDKCSLCANMVYDDESGCYVCDVSLDEDEMYKFVTGTFGDCPYYQNGDEYAVVRKQN